MSKSLATAIWSILLVGTVVAEPSFDIAPDKPADEVKLKISDNATTFDIFSPSGIGGATITLARGSWPATVVLRLHLSGLESFVISSGKTKLTGSVLSHSGNTKHLYLTENGEEREPETEIKVLDAHGKPVVGLPGKGGCFEIKMPKPLLQSKTLTIDWIDFFRG